MRVVWGHVSSWFALVCLGPAALSRLTSYLLYRKGLRNRSRYRSRLEVVARVREALRLGFFLYSSACLLVCADGGVCCGMLASPSR